MLFVNHNHEQKIATLQADMHAMNLRLNVLDTAFPLMQTEMGNINKKRVQENCKHPVNQVVFDSSRTALLNHKASQDSFTAHRPSETDKNCKECCKTLATYKTHSTVCHKARAKHYRALAKYYSELKA